MKKVLIIALLFLLFAVPTLSIGKEINKFQIRYQNGLYYEENQEKPFTGKIIDYYDNGQKKYEDTYKDGKWHGQWIEWHDNGQKKLETTYKDGKKNGQSIYWDKNGKKKSEATYKDGKLIKEKKF